MELADIRKDYKLAALDETEIDASPFKQFEKWFTEAVAAKVNEPNAMTLATVNKDGKPAARIVLIKDFDMRGATFFTNYESRKGDDLAANEYAALVFFWPELERQVRIEGKVEKVSAAESDAYYAVRPLGSRIGAWASPQSRVIPSRGSLEAAVGAQTAALGASPHRPAHWGGYRVVPTLFEFWQGRASRLHDRLCYQLTGTTWDVVRLAP